MRARKRDRDQAVRCPDVGCGSPSPARTCFRLRRGRCVGSFTISRPGCVVLRMSVRTREDRHARCSLRMTSPPTRNRRHPALPPWRCSSSLMATPWPCDYDESVPATSPQDRPTARADPLLAASRSSSSTARRRQLGWILSRGLPRLAARCLSPQVRWHGLPFEPLIEPGLNADALPGWGRSSGLPMLGRRYTSRRSLAPASRQRSSKSRPRTAHDRSLSAAAAMTSSPAPRIDRGVRRRARAL